VSQRFRLIGQAKALNASLVARRTGPEYWGSAPASIATDSAFGPYGRANAVLQADLERSPCCLRRLKHSSYHHACMRDVSALIFIENGGKFGTAEARSVHILARLAGDRQHLINGQVRMLASIVTC
jgi:hypothetical protein